MPIKGFKKYITKKKFLEKSDKNLRQDKKNKGNPQPCICTKPKTSKVGRYTEYVCV
jgi:hypothetical protein